MGDRFTTTQEFREKLAAHMARVDEHMQSQDAVLSRIEERQTSGSACTAGAAHNARLTSLEKTRDEMWDKINSALRPARKAVAVGGLGGISLVAIIEAAKAIWAAFHGGPTP